jgi:hypothetical protein
MATPQHTNNVFVVYPGALLTWWEVVRESEHADPFCFDTREQALAYARALAAAGPGSVVKLENWFGETEAAWRIGVRSISPAPEAVTPPREGRAC